jgi:hypothetical protein
MSAFSVTPAICAFIERIIYKTPIKTIDKIGIFILIVSSILISFAQEVEEKLYGKKKEG